MAASRSVKTKGKGGLQIEIPSSPDFLIRNRLISTVYRSRVQLGRVGSKKQTFTSLRVRAYNEYDAVCF